jgi:pimeloyl-ACP methyl ester carboxylesterase
LYVPVRQRRFVNGEHIGRFAEIEMVPQNQDHTAKSNGAITINVHYYEEGEGFPVVFIHGIGQSLYTWRNNIQSVALSGYRAIALDLPGFGFSDKPDIPYSIEDMSGAIESFLNTLGIEIADFVVFSTGCLYLLDFVYNNPERTGKITLVSPGIPNDGYPPIVKKVYSLLSRLGIFNVTERYVEQVLEQCFFDKTFITKEVVWEYFKPFKNKYTKAAVLAALGNYDYEKVFRKLPDVGKLCLILWSNNDRLNGPEIVEMFHAPIKTAHLYKMRNCGHFLHEEKYDKFNEIFVDFLNWRRHTTNPRL